MNLLQEIKRKLQVCGKTINDIRWIGTTEVYIDINKFLKLADTEYDSGYGSPKVAEDLIIVGENWWLERHEYDGSEWFEYKELPLKPKEHLDIKAITVNQAYLLGYDVSGGWECLKRINGIKEENNE